MKGFSQDQCRCESQKSSVLNTLEELGAKVGIFGRTGEVLNENVGIYQYFRVVWNF